eukprot:4769380-Pyramimonas_sp.AAC.1
MSPDASPADDDAPTFEQRFLDIPSAFPMRSLLHDRAAEAQCSGCFTSRPRAFSGYTERH